MMVPEPQRLTDGDYRNLRMCRTNSETSGWHPEREKIGVRGRSKSLSVRFADNVGGGSVRNKPSCSVLVPPHHRVSMVYVEREQQYPLLQEEPMDLMVETREVTSSFCSRGGSGRGRYRGRRSSPPPPQLLSPDFHHSSLELVSPEASVERRESRVRMLLKGVGSFFRSGKRKFRISSVSFSFERL